MTPIEKSTFDYLHQQNENNNSAMKVSGNSSLLRKILYKLFETFDIRL